MLIELILTVNERIFQDTNGAFYSLTVKCPEKAL